MNRSTPGLPVHHQLLEFTQTHAHRVGDAMQPSHPLWSPSPPPAHNSSQHQGLFWWVSSSHQVAKVLEFQLQHQSFQWTSRTNLLQDGLVGSPCSPRDSQESSPTPQFKSINFSALSFLHSPKKTTELNFLMALEVGSSRSSCWQGWFLLKPWRKDLFQASLLLVDGHLLLVTSHHLPSECACPKFLPL